MKHLNAHLEPRMFLVGHSITAADILAHAHVSAFFASLPAYEQIQLPNTFRWLDHVQHLPGMLELVQQRGLFVPFPDENAQPPSKGQLKKAKKGGDMTNPKFIAAQQAKAAAKEESKGEPKAPVTQVSPATTAPSTAPEEVKQAVEAKPAK